jgi:UDP-glucose 4-epimerase
VSPSTREPLVIQAHDPSEHSMEWANQRVLVTGGNGFIGSHLTEKLVSLGANVTVIDRGDRHLLANLATVADRVEYRQEDLSDSDFDALLRENEYRTIFHFAGSATVPGSVENPWEDFRMNFLLALRMMESLRRSKSLTHLILASSAAVYGDTTVTPISETTPTAPISPYGASKLAIDGYASVYARLYGVRIAVLRPFAVYGPRLRKQVVYDFMRKLSENPDVIDGHGNGTQQRDFCFVTDLVDAAIRVDAAGSFDGSVYNVASGHGVAIGDILGMLSERLGVQPKIRWSGAVRPGEPQRWVADITKICSLGWRPLVGLDEGLNRTVAWFRESNGTAMSIPS